jgi:hypothetical protein
MFSPAAAPSRPEGMERLYVQLLPRLCIQPDGEYDQPWEPACREDTQATATACVMQPMPGARPVVNFGRMAVPTAMYPHTSHSTYATQRATAS